MTPTREEIVARLKEINEEFDFLIEEAYGLLQALEPVEKEVIRSHWAAKMLVPYPGYRSC